MADALEWLKRAKSNLMLAKNIPHDDFMIFGGDIFFEEPCYELQQAVEKSLKAMLLHNGIIFPKTHDIDLLIKLLRNNFIEVPEKILDASIMTQYAVRTRYPDEIRKVTKEEYEEAIAIAENVYNWAKSLVG